MTERIATLQELDSHWTLADIMAANALLDMQNDIKAAQQARDKRK